MINDDRHGIKIFLIIIMIIIIIVTTASSVKTGNAASEWLLVSNGESLVLTE